jgi:hypothetical protein
MTPNHDRNVDAPPSTKPRMRSAIVRPGAETPLLERKQGDADDEARASCRGWGVLDAIADDEPS